jgi:hypothetical protein
MVILMTAHMPAVVAARRLAGAPARTVDWIGQALTLHAEMLHFLYMRWWRPIYEITTVLVSWQGEMLIIVLRA